MSVRDQLSLRAAMALFVLGPLLGFLAALVFLAIWGLEAQIGGVSGYVDLLRWEALGMLVLAAAGMGGLLVWGHHRVVGEPIAELIRSMERVEEGDRDHRAEIKGPREIQELGAELNRMLDSIAEAEAEIAERRQAQISLERQLQQAEKLAAIGQIASGIAHEIGSPLSVIEGRAQRCLREEDLAESERDAFGAIRREVRRVEHVIMQLLEFGRHHDLELRAVPRPGF